MQRQIAGLFVAEQCGTHALKGVPEPIALFRLMRASGAGRRSSQRQLTPLIGRDEEITMLMRRWERARQGNGQLVQIVGEPGLGKSRLIEEFHTRLRAVPHTWTVWGWGQFYRTRLCTQWPNGDVSGSAGPIYQRSGASPISKTLLR